MLGSPDTRRPPRDAKATGVTPARVIGIYLVEKGKPLATPVPWGVGAALIAIGAASI